MTEHMVEGADEALIEIARVSEHGRERRRPPRAHAYVIDVDGIEHVVHQHAMSATAILDLVSKGPDDWILRILAADGAGMECGADDVIVFAERDIVAFETVRHHHRHHHHHHHDGPAPTPGPIPVPPPSPGPAPGPMPDVFILEVVVNGEPVAPEVTPATLLSEVVASSLALARAVGRPDSHWELRTADGNLLNQNLTLAAAHVHSGATLYLSLAAGAAGDGGIVTDPDVSRTKFAAEIARYRKVEKAMAARGQWVIEAEWPTVFAVFAAPVRNALPVVAFGVLIDFTDYDFVAPSVRVVDPFTRRPLKARELPIVAHLPQLAQVGETPDGRPQYQQQNLMQWHSLEDLPFLCVPGVREYHAHPAHTGDDWLARRNSGEGSLYRLLDVLYVNGPKNVVGLQPRVELQVPTA